MKTTEPRITIRKPNPAARNGKPKLKKGLVTCKQVETDYDGQWVVMEIRQWTKYWQPYSGKVVAASPDKEIAYKAGGKYGDKHPKSHLYYFFAGEPLAFRKGVGIIAFAMAH